LGRIDNYENLLRISPTETHDKLSKFLVSLHMSFSSDRHYELGAAVPMLVFADGGRYLGQRLLQLRSHSGTIQKIGGMMIIATAIAMLLGLDVRVYKRYEQKRKPWRIPPTPLKKLVCTR
jgi:uncharacterized membrane protein YfcA